MISVRLVFVSYVLLSTWFGTSSCQIKVNLGEIAIFVIKATDNPCCIKYNGNNLHLGVGELVVAMSTRHEKYKYYADKAKENGTYEYSDSLEIYDLYRANIKKFTDDVKLLKFASTLTGYSDDDKQDNDDKDEDHDDKWKDIGKDKGDDNEERRKRIKATMANS